MKASEKAARAEESFLSNILSIFAPAQQPSPEVERGVDMRQHKLLKAYPIFRIQLAQTSPLLSETHRQEPP
jgi:hypothetical protein